MATFNIYCKRNTNPAFLLTDIWVKNGDIEHPDQDWFSSTMETEAKYDLNVNAGDVIIFQLFPDSLIESLQGITINGAQDASSVFVMPLIKIPANQSPQWIVATVKSGATIGHDLDYLIKYKLPDDQTIYSHDPKIKINNR